MTVTRNGWIALDQQLIELSAHYLRKARRAVAFTGAGISVESGVPPFRGPDGIWSRYDPNCLELRHFLRYPEEAWMSIKEIFYDHFDRAQPNRAHQVLARLEQENYLSAVITQNIDHLHQDAGSRQVIEFHGGSGRLICLACGQKETASAERLNEMPPRCKHCGEILKPDFVFFSEGIPPAAYEAALRETMRADLWFVIGTTGEVMPACAMPVEAKRNGAKIIEINVSPSEFTDTITDVFLQGKATEILDALYQSLHDPLFNSTEPE
ncbi:MAG: NAD-dependent protein deacylase [Anaerolineaceae bacterium]|nr:NAD-dependent protein deacylase [Anaerolineaceae bacterium]